MRRRFVRRWSGLFLLVTLILGLASSSVYAADPQPYEVALKPTGDADLDAAVHDSAALIDLKDKTAVGGFALVQRARDDKDRFQAAARSFGYYNATVGVTIGAQDLDDPALVDRKLTEAVEIIAEGIRGGAFPAVPGEEDQDVFAKCKYCDYDKVCAATRDENWNRKQNEPGASGYLRLSSEEEEE